MSASTDFCSRCGTALQPNSLFCPNCGQRVSDSAPSYPQTQKMAEPVPVPPPDYAAPAAYGEDLYAAPPPARRNPLWIIAGILVGLCLCGFVIVAATFALLGDSIGSLASLGSSPTPTATLAPTATHTPLPPTATPTLPPEPTAELITAEPVIGATQSSLSTDSSDNPFVDDFSTDRGWALVGPEDDPDYTVAWQGQYYSIRSKTASIRAWVFPPLTYTPKDIEFDAIIPNNYSGQNSGTFGVTCHYIDNQNFHQIEIDPFNNAYSIARYRNGERTSLTSENWLDFAGFNQGPGAANHVLVSCEGNNIGLYINDQLALSIDDPTLPVQEETRMGISVTTYEDIDPGGFEMWFDNFSAWIPQQ